MVKNDLNVWTIKKYPEELQEALSNIEIDSQNNILFSNCLCDMRIGSKHVTGNFDTLLYAEDSGILVILMKDGEATADDIRKNLDSRKILYHEVVFHKEEEFECYDDQSIKQLWFAGDVSCLEEAFIDSKTKDSKDCIYYHDVDGGLDLQYLDNNRELSMIDERGNIESLADESPKIMKK